MPHDIKESHLEEICAKCKKDHGNNAKVEWHNHKVYEIIHCQNCNYEIIRVKKEQTFTDKWDMFHRN